MGWLLVSWISWAPLMSRIERKYCLISTSYLVELFYIFMLLYIWQNCVCFGDFFTKEDTLWCLSWGIWISLALNPGHICSAHEYVNISTPPISASILNSIVSSSYYGMFRRHIVISLLSIPYIWLFETKEFKRPRLKWSNVPCSSHKTAGEGKGEKKRG